VMPDCLFLDCFECCKCGFKHVGVVDLINGVDERLLVTLNDDGRVLCWECSVKKYMRGDKK